MKKSFLVEIEYNELEKNKDSHVLYDVGLEVSLDNMMEGYIETNSIEKNYLVKVTEVGVDN